MFLPHVLKHLPIQKNHSAELPMYCSSIDLQCLIYPSSDQTTDAALAPFGILLALLRINFVGSLVCNRTLQVH